MRQDGMQRHAEPELMDLKEEAEAYAAADFSEVNGRFVERVCELAGHLTQANVLDLGTGPGDIPILLAKGQPGWNITAVDGAQAMLEIARNSLEREDLSARIHLVLADAKQVPAMDQSFDVIISNSILHHVSEPLLFWREIHRVAKSGAILCLRDLMRPVSQAAAHELVMIHAGTESPLLQEEFFRSLLAAYTPEEVRNQLSAAGLSMLKVAAVSDRHLDVFGQIS